MEIRNDDNFMREFTEIWNRHQVSAETAQPNGKWETIDGYYASRDNKAFLRANKKLGLYMCELLRDDNSCSSDIRDNESDARDLFNKYVAMCFERQRHIEKQKGGRKWH